MLGDEPFEPQLTVHILVLIFPGGLKLIIGRQKGEKRMSGDPCLVAVPSHVKKRSSPNPRITPAMSLLFILCWGREGSQVHLHFP